jgi:hypothetical protein
MPGFDVVTSAPLAARSAASEAADDKTRFPQAPWRHGGQSAWDNGPRIVLIAPRSSDRMRLLTSIVGTSDQSGRMNDRLGRTSGHRDSRVPGRLLIHTGNGVAQSGKEADRTGMVQRTRLMLLDSSAWYVGTDKGPTIT